MMSGEEKEHTVLVVDDDFNVRDSLQDVLSDEGFKVALAEDGIEALAYLRSNEPPCLILLDLMMPRCDGPSFRAEQVKDPTIADIPVVVFSAGAGLAQKVEALAISDYLHKPVRLDALLATLHRYCPRQDCCS